MRKLRHWPVWIVCVAALGVTCGGCGLLSKTPADAAEEPFEEDTTEEDLIFADAPAVDVVADVGVDAADVPDVAKDATKDATKDAAPDVAKDVAKDVAADVGEDAAKDVPPDVPSDVAPDVDAWVDTGPKDCTAEQVAACDDKNVCTDDTCDPVFGCNHIYNTAPCDDASACTTGDVCLDGTCSGSAIPCDDGKVCTVDLCQPSLGCVHQNASGSCDDGNICTVGESCKAGVCIGGSPADCSDGIACTLDTCEPVGGCQHSSGDGPCDDGSYCTVGEQCTNGVCAGGSPALCNDGNDCTSDGCDPPTGCTFTGSSVACDDANPCTGPDTCKSGVCSGPAFVCVPADLCHSAGICDPKNGTCSPVNAPDGSACEDGLACTTAESCVSGECVGANACDDGDGCSLDACDKSGACTHAPGCTVGGIATGINGLGLKVVSGAHSAVILTDGAFTLSGTFINGANYFVTVANPPQNPVQKCSIGNASGSLHGGNVTDLVLDCAGCGDGTVGEDPVTRVNFEWLANSQTPEPEFMDCWINKTQVIHVNAATPVWYCDVLPQHAAVMEPANLAAIQSGANEFSCQFAQNVAWIVAVVHHQSGRIEQLVVFDYPTDDGGTHDGIRRNSACPGYISGAAKFAGNLDVSLTEGCDDGNLDEGDGCSSVCLPEACTTGVDTDADGLDDCFETATGHFVDQTHTGTSPLFWDTDGDGLSDGDELLGTSTGLDLAALGALALRADIFVEADWMEDDADCATHSHQITAQAEAMAVQMFANAPRVNPDGSTGIALHIDYGQGGKWTGGNKAGNVTEFPPDIGADLANVKAVNFDASRLGYFHYALMMHSLGPSAGGIGELTGDDYIVASGGCDVCYKCQGTNIPGHLPIEAFCHELGHNLGLNHGGDSGCNGKPNYPSIMNYRHAYFGIDVDCDDVPDGALDYARGDRVPLDESALNEADGVCGKFWIDWNKDGSVTPTVKKNLNLDYDPTCGSGAYGAMTDFDDWGSLVFCGVTSGVVPATGTGRKAAVCYDDAESVGKRMRR